MVIGARGVIVSLDSATTRISGTTDVTYASIESTKPSGMLPSR
jgi:hypothetical protein